MTYTKHDEDLCINGLQLQITVPRGGGEELGPGTPRYIQFQYPPSIAGDKRGGDWKETPVPTYGDVMAFYQSAQPRAISMQWSYIVDGNHWNVSLIRNQLRYLRGYFRNPIASQEEGRRAGYNSGLVIYLLIWGVGGDEPMSFRMKSVDVKYGPTMIGNGKEAFFQRSDVTAEFMSWPQLGEKPAEIVPGTKVFTSDWF